MAWELKDDRPIYAQLIEQMELKICSGVYSLGAQVPPVRELAQEASVNPNTMQRALAKLEEDGLMTSHRTSGRFVTEDKQLVERVRNRLAQEHIAAFLKRMEELGFNQQEILAVVSETMKEMKT